jgi:hypothetical protein
VLLNFWSGPKHNGGSWGNPTLSIFYFICTMATYHPKSATGNITTFNIQHGYAEALLRGMRSSFLKDADYHHLTQCETLDDVKLNLTETDYSEALADSKAITPAAFQKVAVDKVGLYLYGLVWIKNHVIR